MDPPLPLLLSRSDGALTTSFPFSAMSFGHKLPQVPFGMCSPLGGMTYEDLGLPSSRRILPQSTLCPALWLGDPLCHRSSCPCSPPLEGSLELPEGNSPNFIFSPLPLPYSLLIRLPASPATKYRIRALHAAFVPPYARPFNEHRSRCQSRVPPL